MEATNEPQRPAVVLSREFQVFSSASDAPRVRWRTDLAAAALLAAALVALIIVAGTGAQLDDDALEFVGTLPGWFQWLGQASYVVAVVYTIGLLVGVGIFAKGRIELFRDMVLAAVVAAATAALMTQYIDDRWPQLALFDLQQTRTTFPMFSITSVVAIQAAAAPHLTLPIRRLGWTAIIAGPVASVLGGVTTISDALGGVLVGLLVASLVRYIFGTTAGLPSIGRVARGLDELGLGVGNLEYHVDQQGPALVLTGTVTGGAPVLVNVLGSDAWNARQLARWWRRAWYQDVGEQYGSDRRQQVEHEALVMYIARSNHAPVPDVVTVGVERARRRVPGHHLPRSDPRRPRHRRAHTGRAGRDLVGRCRTARRRPQPRVDRRSRRLAHPRGGVAAGWILRCRSAPDGRATVGRHRLDARDDGRARRARRRDRGSSRRDRRPSVDGHAADDADGVAQRSAPSGSQAGQAEDLRPPVPDGRGGGCRRSAATAAHPGVVDQLADDGVRCVRCIHDHRRVGRCRVRHHRRHARRRRDGASCCSG